MNERKTLNLIGACGCDCLLPFILVYIFYIILHGHLTPGGGFQGGVLSVAAVVLIDLGHGYRTLKESMHPSLLRKVEGIGVTAYIVIAMMGVILGARFCENIAYLNGDIGALISSGTISWMDEAVAANVFCGVIVIAGAMLSVLILEAEEEGK